MPLMMAPIRCHRLTLLDSDVSANRFRHPITSSSYEAAKLLLQVRRIATDELVNEETRDTTSFLKASTSVLSLASPVTTTRGHSRLRAVSVGSFDDDLSIPQSPVGPALSTTVCVTPPHAPMKVTKEIDGDCEFIPKLELDDSDASENPPSSGKKKLVGHVLKDGVDLKDTLRKKFSWKSFPELEAYLIENREQYLQFSSSLNYTKAQKVYNNRLTQGLLDLAAETGYVFEGFTFAAVRDRIRCFYKSYVQATKKKKRMKLQKRTIR